MLRSELIKRLRAEAEKETPNVYKQVMAEARAEDLFFDLRVKNYRNNGGGNNGNRSSNRGVRRAKLGGGAKALVALSTSLVVLACASVAGFAIWGEQIVALFNKPVNPPAPPMLSLSGNYAVGAVSAARLLSESVSEDGTSVDGGADGVNMQSFDSYFTAFAMFGQNINVACAENGGQSDYNAKATVNAQNYYGAEYDYCIYYTETQKAGTDERTLLGEIAVDGANYYLRGERRVNGDSEVWIKLQVFAGELDSGTYVKVDGGEHAAVNGNEFEYNYTLVKDGKSESSTLKTGGDVIYSLDIKGEGGWNYRVLGIDTNNNVRVEYTAGAKSGVITAKKNGAGYDYTLK